MNLREDDQVSAVALVMESAADTAAEVAEELPGAGPEPTVPVEVDDIEDVESRRRRRGRRDGRVAPAPWRAGPVSGSDTAEAQARRGPVFASRLLSDEGRPLGRARTSGKAGLIGGVTASRRPLPATTPTVPAQGGLRCTGPSSGRLAAGHLQGPRESVTQSSDHLLSLVRDIEADAGVGAGRPPPARFGRGGRVGARRPAALLERRDALPDGLELRPCGCAARSCRAGQPWSGGSVCCREPPRVAGR